jgi:tripartite-type tricarboxylate transporter receptor subunit TctC
MTTYERELFMRFSVPRFNVLTLACAALAMLGAGAAHAQYPSKPVRLVVPVSPGGAPDIIARVVADRLSPLLGQPVVVENRVGSGGNIAMETVARSAPDGYTVMICYDAMIVVNPHVYAKMSLDPMKDIVPVSSVAVAHTFFLVANPSLPVKGLQDFIEYARKATPPLAFASGGSGSQHQMAMELLKLRAGINLLHVPYKGGAPATTAVIGGEVPVMFAGSVNIPQIKAGKLRVLAATGDKRSPLFPDIPTIGELYPGYRIATWLGIFAPAGIPEPAMSRLRSDIGRVLAMPETRERLNTASALDPYATSPEEFAGVIRADYEKYGKLVKQIGLKAD